MTACLLWLLLRQISLREAEEAFSQANAKWVAAALLAFCAGYACRIERWRLMLIHDNPDLRWSQCAGPLTASVAANNVLPLRAGDIVRAFAFNRRLGIQAETSLATLVVERLLDLLVVMCLLGLSLVHFGIESSWLFGLGGSALVGFGLFISGLLIFPNLLKPVADGVVGVIGKILPAAKPRLLKSVQQIFAALAHVSRFHVIVRLLLWSVLAWSAEGLVFWFAALSLPSIVNPLAAWLALPVGTLATVLPSTPGFIGTFDYFVVQAMTMPGNTLVSATVYAFLVHALLWLPSTAMGGLYWLLHPVRNNTSPDTSS